MFYRQLTGFDLRKNNSYTGLVTIHHDEEYCGNSNALVDLRFTLALRLNASGPTFGLLWAFLGCLRASLGIGSHCNGLQEHMM